MADMNENEANDIVSDELVFHDNDDNDDDDGPAYVDMSDPALQDDIVQVDFENEPMDDDATIDGNYETNEPSSSNSPPVPEMSTQILRCHTGPVYTLATHRSSSDGTILIASGGGDDKAFFTKLSPSSDPESIEIPHVFTDTVSTVEFASDGSLLAVGCYDGSILVYKTSPTLSLVTKLDGPTDVEFVRFHPSNTVLLAGSSTDGTVWMYHIDTQRVLQVFVGHESGGNNGDSCITDGGFTSDGKWVVTTGSDGTCRVWNPKKGTCRHVFREEGGKGYFAEGSLTCLDVSGGINKEDSGANLGLVGCEDGTAWIVHLVNKKILSCLHHYDKSSSSSTNTDTNMEEDTAPRSIEAVGFSKSHPHWCATGGADGLVKVWDMNGNNQCRQTCNHRSLADGEGDVGDSAAGVTRLKWHPTKPYIYTTTSDGMVCVWDARNGSCLSKFTGHDVDSPINDVSLLSNAVTNSSMDGDHTTTIVSASDDGTIRLFEFLEG